MNLFFWLSYISDLTVGVAVALVEEWSHMDKAVGLIPGP